MGAHPNIAHCLRLAYLSKAAANRANFDVDIAKGFIVMGESAGGQIAAVAAQRARDDSFFRAHPLTGQIPSIPTVCHPGHYPEKYVFW
jgi:acetyl esterase/lipase